MALDNITFNRGQGGLGRPADGVDFISGLLIYSDATLIVLDSAFNPNLEVIFIDLFIKKSDQYQNQFTQFKPQRIAGVFAAAG